MQSRRSLVDSAIAGLAAALLFSTANPIALPSHLAAVSVPMAPNEAGWVQLEEYRTAGNGGWFYTTRPSDAGPVVSQYHFTKSANIGALRSSSGAGTVAVHRLRAKSGPASYMLSGSSSETRNGNFADEGVIGYVDGAQKPGEVELIRWTKNGGGWRVLAEGAANSKNMQAAGYQQDGPMGWFRP